MTQWKHSFRIAASVLFHLGKSVHQWVMELEKKREHPFRIVISLFSPSLKAGPVAYATAVVVSLCLFFIFPPNINRPITPPSQTYK